MDFPSVTDVDLTPFWTWFLLFCRFGGVMTALPGVGTDEIPYSFRGAFAMLLAYTAIIGGAHATEPVNVAHGAVMIGTEYVLGYFLGLIPTLIISSVSIAGQVNSGMIGLGQAMMIDPSLGEQVTVLARFQGMFATVVFLLVDGHILVLKAAALTAQDVGNFRIGPEMAELFLDRFGAAFLLAIVVSAPIMITILVTQFVLGLLTKFVPQVNVFIISLPLTVGIGLFITKWTLPQLVNNLVREFSLIPDIARVIIGQ